MSTPDALRDALGQVIANERREWRRERELIEAQSRAVIAELRAENLALVTRMEEMVAARLATLRDGRDGADGANGRDGTDGRDGADGAPGERGPAGEPGERGPPGEAGAAGRDGQDGAPGEPGQPGEPGKDGERGTDGRDGVPGERGPAGPIGKLPAVRAWHDAVHYEGDAVVLDGSVYQAQRDTGRAPPHEDWLCIAAAGRDGADGKTFTIRGTWAEAESYRHLDVVALNGASFAARRDEPGPCPGDGWQLIAAQGKRGQAGENGRPGQRGEQGPAGPAVVAMRVSDEGLMTVVNGDGSDVALDLYPLLSRLAE